MAHALQSQNYTFLATLASHPQVITDKINRQNFRSNWLITKEIRQKKLETITFMKQVITLYKKNKAKLL